MSYEPMDRYLPSAHGGAQVPQFVGQRESAARSYAASAGWTVIVRHVPVHDRRHPDGFVVHQAPAAGSVAPIGSVLAVDVSRRGRVGERHGRALLAGACVALAVSTGGFAALWLEERRVDPVVDTPDRVPARVPSPAPGSPAPGSPAPGSPAPGSPAPGSSAPGSPAPTSAPDPSD